MIKATGMTSSGRPLLILGLTGENVTRLMAGEPIRIDTAEMHLGAEPVIAIYGGKDQAALIGQLADAGLVHPDALADLRADARAVDDRTGQLGASRHRQVRRS